MDDESPPPLPIRPTPTSLFQPFLPRPQGLHSEKPLPFSIDNILRPTFGRNLWAASPFLSSSFMAAAAFAAAAAQAAQATPPQTSLATPLSPTLSTASSNSSTPTPIKREEKHHHQRLRLKNRDVFSCLLQGCIYRGSRGSLGYPGFWVIIKAEAIKREIFEDFYL